MPLFESSEYLNNYINSLWDYRFINDVLPGKISVSDIDGYIERKGKFLFLEFKGTTFNTNYLDFKDGQERALLSLAKLPGVSVLVIAGRAKDTKIISASCYGTYSDYLGASPYPVPLLGSPEVARQALAVFVNDWFSWASRG